MASLGPTSFGGSPILSTTLIPGPIVSDGDLFFSPDDRYLCVHSDGSHLRIWDGLKSKSVEVPDGFVQRSVWCASLQGVLSIVDNCVSLYSLTDGECDVRLLTSEIPEIALEERADLACAKGQLIVCTSRFIRTYDTYTGLLQSSNNVPCDEGFQVRRVSTRMHDGETHVTVLSLSRTRIRFDVLDTLGNRISTLDIEREGWRIFDYFPTVGVRAIKPLTEHRAIELFLGASGTSVVHIVEPIESSMLEFSASCSTVVARTTPQRLAIFEQGSPTREVICDGTWYNAWPSDDGKLVVITYSTGLPGAADLTGVLDLVSGRPLGQCHSHMCSTPYAVSPHNRYVASIITESLAATHPSRLPAGSLLVTDLTAARTEHEVGSYVRVY